MRSSLRKVETLVMGDDGNIALVLLLRTYENGKQVYGCRIRIQKKELAQNQEIIQQSLETGDYEKAKQEAYLLYSKVRERQERGLKIKATSVEQALDNFLSEYAERLANDQSGYTSNILRNFRKSIHIYWREYIGKKDIEDVSDKDMEGYEQFRRKYAKNTDRKKGRWGQQYKETVAAATLKGEINYFRQFLRWCAQRGIYKGAAHEWRFKTNERIRNRREAFSLEQYQQLYRYMRTNEFLNKGKHQGRGSADTRIKRHRHMIRAYILFLANTGIRVGEARHLKWKDVEKRQLKTGATGCVVTIDNTQSKVTKGATRSQRVIGRYTAWRAIERWKEYLVSIGEDVSDEKFIFCNDKGKTIQHFREGFDAVITEAGVDKDRYGNKFVIYTLRHTYITFRLRYGKNINIHRLAQNARTSIQMIQSFYDDTDTDDFVEELIL
jgi:integrase